MSELIVNPVTPWIDVEQVMLDLNAEIDSIPFDAIRLIQKHPQLFIPRLIETIDNAVTAYETDELRAGDAPLFALFLLTEFRAQEAWPAIRRALRLPDEGSYCLFGSAAYESLDRILAVFAAGYIEILDELLSFPELDPFVRIEVTAAFFYLVRDGLMTRDEAVERLHRMLRAAIADVDGQTATELVMDLAKYGPHEALEEIRSAYRDGLIDPDQIELSEVEESIAIGEMEFHMLLDDCPPTGFRNTVHELEAWAMSQDESEVLDDFDDEVIIDSYERGQEQEIDPGFLSAWGMVKSMLRRQFEEVKPIDMAQLIPDEPEIKVGTIHKTERRVGRNETCPCGSGKKYKKCCGGS